MHFTTKLIFTLLGVMVLLALYEIVQAILTAGAP